MASTAFIWVEFVLLRGVTPPIESDRGIAQLECIRLGGVEQWILVRGDDRRQPVILWLHGGPGNPGMYLAHAFQRPLEKDFVVVHWDRPGAGKSLAAATGRSLTVSKTLADTLELTRMLRQRFGQDRVYLVGHSWGSYLGLLAIREHPEYYRAFVGTGVLAGTREEVDRLRRVWLEERARSLGDSELQSRLSSGDRVSESDVWRYGGELYGATDYWPIVATGLAAPEYTLWDALAVRKGTRLVAERMVYDVSPKPLEGEIERLGVPVAFFLGRHDYNTPSRLASDYLERLEAPFKRLCWFESSAHFPFFSQPEEFHRQLLFLHRELSRP